ncbi:MAG: squalene/phytoene synthase family protein [Hyphomonadaceae bacterium JAD_PAG50586_4]|nr:MAG: squalene/phytoene synthase family protein [Hyphomonadaceae bacterium JAD_PAG50586_4]
MDALVRRVDEDRWLATRFAPAEVRAKLIALYAAYYEIAHTTEAVREAALGDIRLEWWRRGVEEIAEGKPPRAHPVLAALKETGVSLDVLPQIIATRARDLDAAPFATWAALDAYLDGTAGALMRGAIEVCAPGAVEAAQAFVQSGARAWGYTGLLRAAPYWQARGRSVVPRDASIEEMKQRALAAYGASREASRGVPASPFAAIGYVAFVPRYLKALARERDVSLFTRHGALVVASATGRI